MINYFRREFGKLFLSVIVIICIYNSVNLTFFNEKSVTKIFKEVIKKIPSKNINFFENKQDFPKNYLIKQLKAGKKVYFKGSRSSKMESYLGLLIND